MVEEVSSEAPFSTQKCSPNAPESREREVGETFSSPKLPPEASWAALGPPRGSKEVGLKFRCCILHRFGSPRGGSGGPLGSPWGRFGRSRSAFWRSRGCFLRSPRRSRRRSGTRLGNETFVGRFLLRCGLRFGCFFLLALSVAGAVILPCSCVAFSLCFLLSFVVVCCARKRRARRIGCKNEWNLMMFQSWSRRPRFETKTEHDTTTSSNATFPGDQTCSIFFIFWSRKTSRTGWSKRSLLKVGLGSIFDPKMLPKCSRES